MCVCVCVCVCVAALVNSCPGDSAVPHARHVRWTDPPDPPPPVRKTSSTQQHQCTVGGASAVPEQSTGAASLSRLGASYSARILWALEIV